MLILSEKLPVFLQCQYVAVGIDSCLIQLIQGNKLVPHLVAWIAEHQNHFLRSHGDPPQADGKTVSRQDGEDHADGLSSQLGPHVSRNRFH